MSTPPSNEQNQSVASGSSVEEQLAFKVFKPATSAAPIASQDIPDSFFVPTAADLKVAQATLSARTNALNNAPLQLRSKRDAAEKAKRERWPNTTIRIKFADRTQLEKTFQSTDKIRSVYAFVRNSLREDVKPIKFILYQPPKRDLKVSDLAVRDLTLAELQLAPSSMLLLRFEDDSLNGSDVPAPLAPSILAHATDLPTPPTYDVESPAQPSTSESPVEKPAGEKKIPKWLKAGMRK
ncbi:hypothetical protein PLICRDRAFT_39726 [Plicaturopsis crispa FD-325 SS-3]|nr:hypothetical protein PLICRDRAFT_39726 [Plicaturopsis crispa FD-325 SS-3]